MNEGIHLDLDTWIVPGQIRKANLCRGLGNRYTPAGTEVIILYLCRIPYMSMGFMTSGESVHCYHHVIN